MWRGHRKKHIENLTQFDVAEYLDIDKLQNLYLGEVAKEDDSVTFIKAVDTAARANGMTKIVEGDSNFE